MSKSPYVSLYLGRKQAEAIVRILRKAGTKTAARLADRVEKEMAR